MRVPELIKHILERGQPVVKGLMCYSATEAEFLFNEFGLDDIMIAYPSVQEGNFLAVVPILSELRRNSQGVRNYKERRFRSHYG